MPQKTRVRFPPSPTGEPHVGNIRTAIFNWLLAKKTGGVFVIRIEDTDLARKVDGAVESILQTLKWLGIGWDEGPEVGGENGPYFQSQRLSLYDQAANDLLANGHAYYCYCSSERLSKLRKSQSERKVQLGYDGYCKKLTSNDVARLKREDSQPVVRFSMPSHGTTSIVDLIRGKVTFENQLLDDFVILKSDGFPTYHLANVVDDNAMHISHVLRAEEWLPSTPRHVLIYQALGLEPPQFAHLPIILAPDKSKLSKRHGATSALDYREQGFLPEAMVNFLTLLGWSLDDKTEIFSVEELIANFSLDRVSKSGAVFDIDKLTWLNGHYIRNKACEELADLLIEYWSSYPPYEIPELPNKHYLTQIVPLIQERLKTLSDAAPLTRFFFNTATTYSPAELIQKGMDSGSTLNALECSLIELQKLECFDHDIIEISLRQLAASLELKVGQLLGTLRVAITGLQVSPPLFESMSVLGKDRCLAAIRIGIGHL